MFEELENKRKEEMINKQNEIYIEIGKISATRAATQKINRDRIAELEAKKKEIESELHRIKHEENFYQNEYLKKCEKLTSQWRYI